MSAFRQVQIIDGETHIVGDILTKQLQKSVQQSCKHERKRVVSTSESGSNTTFIGYDCPDCRLCFTEEVLPAEYLRLLADDYTETEKVP